MAAEKIADFLEVHQERREALGLLDEELSPYHSLRMNDRTPAAGRVPGQLISSDVVTPITFSSAASSHSIIEFTGYIVPSLASQVALHLPT